MHIEKTARARSSSSATKRLGKGGTGIGLLDQAGRFTPGYGSLPDASAQTVFDNSFRDVSIARWRAHHLVRGGCLKPGNHPRFPSRSSRTTRYITAPSAQCPVHEVVLPEAVHFAPGPHAGGGFQHEPEDALAHLVDGRAVVAYLTAVDIDVVSMLSSRCRTRKTSHTTLRKRVPRVPRPRQGVRGQRADLGARPVADQPRARSGRLAHRLARLEPAGHSGGPGLRRGHAVEEPAK